MGLEKVRDLALAGFSSGATELISIPTTKPIRELRLDIRMSDADGGYTVTGDPFNLVFESIELIFDGDTQYIITSYADLQQVAMLHTGRKAQVSVSDDSNASASEDIHMRFSLPVMWRSTAQAQIPQLRIVWQTASGLTTVLNEIRVVYTDDVSNFQSFKLVKVPQTSSSGGTLLFRPATGSTVRGAFIVNVDASVTAFSAGGHNSLAEYGGANGISQMNLSHKGVDYWLQATVRDVQHHMYEIFRNIGEMGLYDDLLTEHHSWAESPFTYGYITADSGGDGIPADAYGYAGLNPFLYMSFEDIVADTNTQLSILSDTGTYGAGDQIIVTWVYKQDPPSSEAK